MQRLRRLDAAAILIGLLVLAGCLPSGPRRHDGHAAGATAAAAAPVAAAASVPATTALGAPADGELFRTSTAEPGAGAAAAAEVLPAGFSDTVALSGVKYASGFAFAPDGKIFVVQRTGVVMVFDSLADPTPSVFADLTSQVYNQYDRGLLGIAVDPAWPARPYVYVFYSYDGDVGGPSPKWGTGTPWDTCPDPPGSNTQGCVISSRLSRLTASGGVMSAEKVLVQGWCQQFSSHSVGAIHFGADGALYATAGEGASYLYSDYGQTGNPCADPPGAAGTGLTPPTAEGGRLRAQSPRRAASEPAVLNGTLIRVDPDTGAGRAGNPMFASTDANRRRIVAYGLRNPFRFTQRPGTDEVWIGDVGGGPWEEIDRVTDPTPTTAYNFGWPCYDGAGRQASFDNLNLTQCETLYAQGASGVTAPYYAYSHLTPVVTGDGCTDGNGASVTGVSFYAGTSYPSAYQGALFFADYSRQCIWYLPKGANGLPDTANPKRFVTNAQNPVDLEVGPNGDLFYADLVGGTIRRITATAGNTPPVAVATATPTAGAAPLTVKLSAAQSSDADLDALTYSWDLDGNGTYGDASTVAPTTTYTSVGTVTARVRVTDAKGASSTASVAISVGNDPPVPRIASPTTALRWKVGDTVPFAGSASDAQDGTIPAARLTWSLLMHHCPTGLGCHVHQLDEFAGVTSGSFSAPDHEYPSYLELVLTATDARGLSASTSVDLTPATAPVTLRSNPPGLVLGLSDGSAPAPYTATALAGATVGLDAPGPQVLNGVTYTFSSWSDGGAAAHTATVPPAGATYTATFTPTTVGPGPNDAFGGTTLDTAAWTAGTTGSAVRVANGQLEITHPAGGWTNGSITSAKPFDQTGRAVQLRLQRAANVGLGGTTFGQTTVAIRLDATHEARFFVADGTLTAWSDSGAGSVNLTPSRPAYDFTAMRWLRFRETAGRLYWEYAAGTATTPGPWKVLASAPDPFSMRAVSLRILAGANTAAADVTKVDDISTELGTGPNDAFGGTALSTATWTKAGTGSTVAIVGQQLEIAHPAGAWTNGSIVSAAPYDQTGKVVRLQLVRAANLGKSGTTFGQTTFAIRIDATHEARFFVASGALTAWSDAGAGSVNLTPSRPTYNPTTMRWLRFRESAGRLYWEYAGGTATAPGAWTVLASTPDPFSMKAVRLRILAGANTTTADVTRIDDIATGWTP